MSGRRRPLFLALLAAAVLLPVAGRPAAADATPGWKRIDIPATGSYLERYVPRSLEPGKLVPVILFLHGSNGTPELYEPFMMEPAEASKAIVVLPKSSATAGWGSAADELTVAESLRLVKADLAPLATDDLRISIAGHSAGGAYAFLLAYGAASHYSAVFTLSAPYYSVAAVADPAYRAPIRMYYGTTDPNYTDGPYAELKAQWDRLGVPWQEDIGAGFGHNTWPLSTMLGGFAFLVAQSYPAAPPACVPGPGTFCLLGGRFRVEVTWSDAQGEAGAGTTAGCPSDGSGLFWFFSPDNWEMLVKVIDGCAVNQRYWVFLAATTNVGYTLTVTDTATGQAQRYANPVGVNAPAVTDTSAFATCP